MKVGELKKALGAYHDDLDVLIMVEVSPDALEDGEDAVDVPVFHRDHLEVKEVEQGAGHATIIGVYTGE